VHLATVVRLDGQPSTGVTAGSTSRTNAPKTKGHLKALVHRLFGKAKLYGMVDWVESPIELVEVRGISKRRRKPADLTID
jgi:hypothetical protein